MFVCNLKLNGNKLYRIFFIILITVAVILLILSIYNIFKEVNSNQDNSDAIYVLDDVTIDDTSEISSENYTNTLKQVHDNLNEYIGRKISFVGYIYRLDELESNQFVLARNMVINSVSQTVVVGFLCEYDNINDFDNLTWVHVIGTIEKGYLDGDIPLLKVTSIEKTDKPETEFVYPPDDTYIPTSILY